jgi:hypothetical protein
LLLLNAGARFGAPRRQRREAPRLRGDLSGQDDRRAIERDQIVAARDVADFDNFARPEVADSRKAESGTPNAPSKQF